MQAIKFRNEKEYIEAFLSLPQKLYTQKEITQAYEDEEKLLHGTHYLSHYVTLTPFLVMENNKPLARCLVTEYPDDQICYFGFFECVNDQNVLNCLMDAVENFAMDKQYTAIEGPVDVSLWLGYRFKSNCFDLPPYLGEPYNKAYYLDLFYKRQYTVKESYVSNQYSTIPKVNFELDNFKNRFDHFIQQGYEIRSPKMEEWDQCISEIYHLISVLYKDFLTYHAIHKDEFISLYNSYKNLVDLTLIKMAYYQGEAVGFFMGAPDYGNLASRHKNLSTIINFLKIKNKPSRYVLLYMGVLPEHKGIGMALTHSIMMELAKKQTPSIGSLIRNNNKNFNYAIEYMVGRYEYQYIERKFTISDYIKRCAHLWQKENYIAERIGDQFSWHTFGDFTSDVKKCAHFLLKNGLLNKNIGIYGSNSYLWMVSDISIMGYVGTCFPFDAQYGKEELRNLLAKSGIEGLLYTQDKKAIIEEIKDEFSNILFFNVEDISKQWVSLSDEDDFAPVCPTKAVKVIFTSGTSAMPKGVMLSQANMFSNWNALFRRTPMTHDDSILLVLPLNHIYAGVAAFLYSMISGMKIYLGTPHPVQCMCDFEKYKPSVFIGVPLLAEKMWDIAVSKENVKEAFGGNLKYFYCGGAETNPVLKQNYINAHLPFIEAYGTTETSSVLALDVIGNYKQGSTGVLMESIEAKVNEPDENGVGELFVRGGSRMIGYFEDATDAIDEDGYFHTGDLARIDESRHLYILGRIRKLLITSNGKNVYPREVEALACEGENINRATLYLKDDRLHLKVWYNGNLEYTNEFLENLRNKLPRYMQYESYECIEDSSERRIK